MGANIPNAEARPFSTSIRTALAANVAYSVGTNAIMSAVAIAPQNGALYANLTGNCTLGNGSGWFVIDITGVADSEKRCFVHGHSATPDALISARPKYPGLTPGQSYTFNVSYIVNTGTCTIDAVASPTVNHLAIVVEG